MNIRKETLIKEVSSKTGIDKVLVKTTVAAFMDTVKEHVVSNERVSLKGFGIFYAKKRAAKIGRDLNKNTPINIPAHYAPVFNPVPKFKEKVRTGVK